MIVANHFARRDCGIGADHHIVAQNDIPHPQFFRDLPAVLFRRRGIVIARDPDPACRGHHAREAVAVALGHPGFAREIVECVTKADNTPRRDPADHLLQLPQGLRRVIGRQHRAPALGKGRALLKMKVRDQQVARRGQPRCTRMVEHDGLPREGDGYGGAGAGDFRRHRSRTRGCRGCSWPHGPGRRPIRPAARPAPHHRQPLDRSPIAPAPPAARLGRGDGG